MAAQKKLTETMQGCREKGLEYELKYHLGRIFLHKHKDDGEEENDEPEEGTEPIPGMEDDEVDGLARLDLSEGGGKVDVKSLSKAERKKYYAEKVQLKKEVRGVTMGERAEPPSGGERGTVPIERGTA